MLKTTTLAAATAITLALGFPAAFAAGTTELPEANAAPTPAAINAFQNAKTTLPQAIQAAEQHSNGKAFDVSFTDQGGTPVYMIDTFHNNTVWQGEVDAGTGKVVGQGK
jgi:uncharacterized membrane protein YkoI